MEISTRTFFGVLAGLFVLLFIATTMAAFALFSVEQSVFDAQLYIQALDEENVYLQLPELTAQALASAAQRPGRSDLLSIFRNLSQDEWRGMVVELLPPDILRALTVDVLTQIMAYLNGEREIAYLTLSGLKAHLQSPEGVSAIYGMLKTQPDCTLEQLSAMTLNQQALTLCSPPDSFLIFDLRPIVEAQIKALLSLIPDQVTLISAGPNRLQTMRDLNALRLFMRLSPLMPVTCLLVITILAVRSFRDWLVWWGYALLSAGLFSMLLSALSGLLSSLTFQVFLAPFLPEFLSTNMVDVFRDLTAAIVRHAIQPVVLLAGIMAAIGLVMVGLAFLLRRRFQRSPSYYRQV